MWANQMKAGCIHGSKGVTAQKGTGLMISNAIASLAVKDLSQAAKWYERLLGRAPDSMPMNELVEWKFAGGGWLQVYQLRGRAGNGSCTLSVTDLDREITRLRDLGVEAGSPTESSTVRVVMIQDPDGNSVAMAEAKDNTIAQ